MRDAAAETLLEALMDSNLYSMGAAFSDEHPELVEDVIAQADDIERLGLERWARDEEVGLEVALQTFVTGLALRYYRAVTG